LPTRSADYPLAVASGVLLALSFPKFGHPLCAWLALTPLFVALGNRPGPRRAFGLGLATGVVYFTGTLYWITRVMVVYGGLPAGAALAINGALIAYLALFPAIFAIVTARLVARRGRPALMAAPLVWVATELGRTWLFTGFPWVLLGYSQVEVLPVAQLASVFGVYGVSALIVGVSAAAACAVPWSPGFGESSPGADRLNRYQPLLAMALLVVIVTVWGGQRVASSALTRAGTVVRVGIVQGNVDQAQKWNIARAQSIFQDYLRMTRQAIAGGAALVLWPESSAPFHFEEDAPGAEQVRALARESRVPILVGSDQAERGAVTKLYNSAFLVGAGGATEGIYRKMHLVPFGEYVPLQRLLFFAAPMTAEVGTFSAGDTPNVLPVGAHRISVAICYEIVYPDLVRQFVSGGSELLTTITNDAWFGDTSAPYQHFAQASMRAIENGRYLVRSANTGISGIVDPYGRIVTKGPIFAPAVMVGDARFLGDITVYSRTGDIFGYAATVLSLVLALI
jgi:apolipoprotein N-acyltransferase